MRDVRSYCGILLDDNNRKPICRLRFNSSKKYVSLFHAEDEERVQIETVDGYLPVCESAEAGGSELPCRRVDTDATSPSHPATNPHLTSLLLAVPFTSAALSSKMNVTKPFAYLEDSMATHLTSSDAEKLKQLEGRVDKLEIRVSQNEDPMQVILENVLDLRRVLDLQGQLLLRIAARLDIDANLQ